MKDYFPNRSFISYDGIYLNTNIRRLMMTIFMPIRSTSEYVHSKMISTEMQSSRTPEAQCPGLLPPIVTDSDVASSTDHLSPVPWKSPKTSSPEHKRWSRYHSGCTARDSHFMDWTAVRKERKKDGYNERKPSKRQGRLEDFGIGNDVDHTEYFENNKDLVEAYVIERIPIKELEKWLQKKIISDTMKNASACARQATKFKYKASSCKKQMFMDLIMILEDVPNEHSVLWELSKCVTSSIGVDAYRIYKLFPDHPNFVQYFVVDKKWHPYASIPPRSLERCEANHTDLILEVAKRGTTWRMSKEDNRFRFPKPPQSLFRAFSKNSKDASHILYQPILNANGKTVYVIEMWRIKCEFKEIDEEISSNFLVWGSLAMHYCNLYLDKKRERNMTDFLLDVVKAIFEEMVSLDQLIKRILEFVQRLVNADRASLFLVDYRNFELVSTVFDLKFEPGIGGDVEKKEIRMPISRGIAGHVALSGETMNIPDVYSDYRFNRAVDEATGYKTVNILCMPIKVQGKVIGVVQMVNKRSDDNFDHEDEVAFETFSTFFGLALHHARLYDKIMRQEQKYRVALEVLSYHNTCRENEVHAILSDKEQLEINLSDFYLDPFKFNEFEKCKAVIRMFSDLFDISKFDIVTVTRFVLTVKKNYRTVPYHNFDHGWSVANAMYVIIKNDVKERFNYKIRLSLFVACLCHDLDHRGYTNKYMSETASPLAAMYTTSTLEHHHFNITVTILQQDGHNIFSHMTSKEYKEILSLIKQSILATDLAAFFPNLEKIKVLCDDDDGAGSLAFSWAVVQHRDLAMAISMTAADLSASAKPWGVQIKTVKVIFEEFYDQGDKEREAGKTPIPMMDRNKPEEQPDSQVGFLSQICIPCYQVLSKILPDTKPMYVMALRNLNKWQSRANRVLKNKSITSKFEDVDDEFSSNSEDESKELGDKLKKIVIEADSELKEI